MTSASTVSQEKTSTPGWSHIPQKDYALSFMGQKLSQVPSAPEVWAADVSFCATVSVQWHFTSYKAFLVVRELEVAIGLGSTPEGALADLEGSMEEQADSMTHLASQAKKARLARLAKPQ